jgi:hypothetical protein
MSVGPWSAPRLLRRCKRLAIRWEYCAEIHEGLVGKLLVA